jgi:hypothetical protein
MSDSLESLLAQQANGGAPASADPLEAMLAAQAAAPATPAAPVQQQDSGVLGSIGRQLGLTGRYGLEGLANTAQIITEPIRHALSGLAASIPTQGDGGYQSPLMASPKTAPQMAPVGAATTTMLDAAGLPSPKGKLESVIGDATRLVAGAGGTAKLAQMAGGAVSPLMQFAGRGKDAVTGAATNIGQVMAQNLPQQLASAGGAGLAGGTAREYGAPPATQALASLVGGVAGGFVPGFASGTVNAAKNLVGAGAADPAQLDARIGQLLQGAGIDYSKVPDDIRASMRSDMAAALKTGDQVDPQAAARLLDFKTVGATPTRGMVSLDPVQITREMNLAKTAANTSDNSLTSLPMIQNRNNSTLIQNLNDAGAKAGDPFAAGQSAINAIGSKDQALAQGVSDLYSQARDTAGRSANLDGAAFTTNANAALDKMLLGGALPQSVATHMNKIATGEVPFNVDYAEQLKTAIGNLQRATNDGQTRMALGVVRKALDDTPLMPAAQVNPGNLPAVPGTVPPSPSVLGQDSIDAFNQARQAARSRFAWQESGKPIEAALNGAQPDKFVQQYVIGGSLKDAQAIADNAPIADVKNAILAHLKDKALNGAADEVGKFSQSAYNKALDQIGDRKLALFFSPQEVGRLRSVGRVASYMQTQPVGSAVNNSNSGALLLGKGYDALKGLAAKIPGGQSLLVNPLNNIESSMNARAARNIVPGLLVPQQQMPIGARYLLTAIATGGLLSAP